LLLSPMPVGMGYGSQLLQGLSGKMPDTAGILAEVELVADGKDRPKDRPATADRFLLPQRVCPEPRTRRDFRGAL
jgi:hypothetical protein